jgi:hypothetical protein
VDAPHYAIGFPLALSLAAGAVGVVLVMRFWFVERYPDFARTGYGRTEGGDEEYAHENAGDKLDMELGAKDTKDVVAHTTEHPGRRSLDQSPRRMS